MLVGSRQTLDGLVFSLPREARDLVEAFWPGALTIVVEQAPTLQWDLGDTYGTVAVRMPLHPVALEVLQHTGPLAVSGANRIGLPPAITGGERPRPARVRGDHLSRGGSVLGPDTIEHCRLHGRACRASCATVRSRSRSCAEVVPNIQPFALAQPLLPGLPSCQPNPEPSRSTPPCRPSPSCTSAWATSVDRPWPSGSCARAARSGSGEGVEKLYLSHGAGTGAWHVGEPMNAPAARELFNRGADNDGFLARASAAT